MDAARISIVVDLGSYRHRIADLADEPSGDLPDLSVVALADLLVDDPARLDDVWVAAPFIPVGLGVGGDRRRAGRTTDHVRRWWDGQRSEWARSRFARSRLRRLSGGFDGHREVGVDVLVAAAALEAAEGLADEEHGVVLVCSHDSDLYELNQGGAAAPIVVVGAFSHAEASNARRLRAPHLRLADGDLVSVGIGRSTPDRPPDSYRIGWTQQDRRKPPELVATRPSAGKPQRLGRVPIASPERRAPLRPVECIADPYGIFNAAMRALGVADLPNAASIGELVTSLGWDGPIGIRATLPDLSNGHAHASASVQGAWRDRDASLDALAAEFDEDGDAATVQRRALLQPTKADVDGRYERDVTPYAIKRQSTGLLLDLWLSTSSGARDVVLLSEDPDLVFALEQLPGSGVERYRGVVRVGLHSHRYLRRPGATDGGATRLPFIVMTEVQTARLCRVLDRPYGTVLRHGLATSLRSADPRWSFERIDPESHSIVMSVMTETSDGAPERIEVLVYGLDDLFGAPAEVIEGAVRCLPDPVLRFDPERPCAHPLIDTSAVAPASFESGVVVSHRGHEVGVDVDGDGAADVRTTVGHTFQRFPAGTRVDVARVGADRAGLADPGQGLGVTPGVEVAELVDVGGRFPELRSLSDGSRGPALPPPGDRELVGCCGDRYLAVRRRGRDGAISWIVLSSPLQHLLERSMTEPGVAVV